MKGLKVLKPNSLNLDKNPLDDITIKQYKEYEKILDANKNDANSERFIYLKMVEIFCGIPYEYANKMRLNDFERIVSKITDVLIQQPKLVTKFKMGDSTFGFIPDLEEMTYGEFVDLDTYIHDMDNIEKVELLPYHKLGAHKWEALGIEYPLDGVNPPSKETMDEIVSVLSEYHSNVKY